MTILNEQPNEIESGAKFGVVVTYLARITTSLPRWFGSFGIQEKIYSYKIVYGKCRFIKCCVL